MLYTLSKSCIFLAFELFLLLCFTIKVDKLNTTDAYIEPLEVTPFMLQMVDDWTYQPIVDIQAIKNYGACPTDYYPMFNFTWPGLVEGVQVTVTDDAGVESQAIITVEQCISQYSMDDTVDCTATIPAVAGFNQTITVPIVDKSTGEPTDGVNICFKRGGETYLNVPRVDENGACAEGYTACNSVSKQSTCYPSDQLDLCPIVAMNWTDNYETDQTAYIQNQLANYNYVVLTDTEQQTGVSIIGTHHQYLEYTKDLNTGLEYQPMMEPTLIWAKYGRALFHNEHPCYFLRNQTISSRAKVYPLEPYVTDCTPVKVGNSQYDKDDRFVGAHLKKNFTQFAIESLTYDSTAPEESNTINKILQAQPLASQYLTDTYKDGTEYGAVYRGNIPWLTSCEYSDSEYLSRQQIYELINNLNVETTNTVVYSNNLTTFIVVCSALALVFSWMYPVERAMLSKNKLKYSLLLIILSLVIQMVLVAIEIGNLNQAIKPLEVRDQTFTDLQSIAVCSVGPGTAVQADFDYSSEQETNTDFITNLKQQRTYSFVEILLALIGIISCAAFMFIRPASTGESNEETQPMVQDNENQVDPNGLTSDD